jgi:hypothetical protein
VEIEIGQGRRSCEQHKAPTVTAPPAFEVRPRAVPRDGNRIEIVHAGTAEGAVGRREAGRLDNMRFDAQTCAEA